MSGSPASPQVATRLSHVRNADDRDNDALVELTRVCPMRGQIALCVERSPDFFARLRMLGEPWKVFVSENVDGAVVGCMSVVWRTAHVNGEPRTIAHVGDLRVRPDHRGGALAAADQMIRHAVRVAAETSGSELLAVLFALTGNRALERRAGGGPGLPMLSRVGAVRVFSIPLLWGPLVPEGLRVIEAGPGDIEEMVSLWQRCAPRLQFGEALDGASFAAWLERAQGLGITDYLLARDRRGALLGFLGLWDQQDFKQLRIVSYSRSLVVPRAAFNVVARWAWAAPLPPPGGRLGVVDVVNPCTPVDDPSVLRALLIDARRRWRAKGCSLIQLALDARDPRCRALRGLLAPSTPLSAYVTSSSGAYTGAPLDARPLHHDVALV